MYTILVKYFTQAYLIQEFHPLFDSYLIVSKFKKKGNSLYRLFKMRLMILNQRQHSQIVALIQIHVKIFINFNSTIVSFNYCHN